MRLALPAVLLVLLVAGCDASSPDPSGPGALVRYAVDGAATVTYTDADGSTRTATPAGPWTLDVDVAAGRSLVLTASSSTPVTATLAVGGTVVASRQGRSVRIERSSSDDRAEVEVYGPVEALSADRVTVAGRVFVVDAGTRLFDRNNQPVPLSTFSVGTFVEAEGRLAGDGTYRAEKIKLEDGGGDDGAQPGDVEVHGALQAIDAESVSVAGRRFLTSASTRYLDDRNTPVSRDAFRAGDLVEVEGHALADGTLRADKLKRDND